MSARLFERNRFCRTRYELGFPGLPKPFDGLAVAFLSDLHGKTFGEKNRELTEAVLDFGPDLLLIGGDNATVKPHRKQDFSALEGLLEGLGGRIPVYAGEGNHETRMRRKAGAYPGWHEAYEALLARHAVTELKDSDALIERNGSRIRIAGITLERDQYLKGPKKPVLGAFFEKKLKHSDDFTILLMHSPAYLEEAAAWGADLTLAGHYHGGTIYVPKLGGLMTPQFVFFEKTVRGVFDYGGQRGVVSAGLGTHSVNLRVNNPPEIVELILHAES